MTNTFKVGDKVRVNSSFKESKLVGREGIVSEVGGVYPYRVKGIDADFDVAWGGGLFLEIELDLIPVRKFKAGDRVYVSNVSGNTNHPYVGVHTVEPRWEDSMFDYTLDGKNNKAVYESEIEALPTEFTAGEWVKVLEIPERWNWVRAYFKEGDVLPVVEKNNGGSTLKLGGTDSGILKNVNGLDTSGSAPGVTLIKVDAPVSEPTTQEKIDAALKALEDAQNAVDEAIEVASRAADTLDDARAQLAEAVK